MTVAYSKHGGRHNVALVQVPNICGNRLVHLSQDGPASWVIRDFIFGKQLLRSPPPNKSFSWFDLSEIEKHVVYHELPPFHSRKKVADWEAYLRLRTILIDGEPDDTPPNPDFGDWQPLD